MTRPSLAGTCRRQNRVFFKQGGTRLFATQRAIGKHQHFRVQADQGFDGKRFVTGMRRRLCPPARWMSQSAAVSLPAISGLPPA